MIKASALILLPLLSFFWLACGVLVAGSYYPDYSHLSQFMSALGATGTAYGATVNLVVFAGAELWVLLFVGLAVSAVGKDGLAIAGLSLIGFYALLLLVAAYYPCDFECRPEEPSISHLIHISAGLLAYVFGLVGLFVISCALKRRGSSLLPRGTATGLFLTGALLLAGTVQIQEFAGLLQRLLEVLIYLWLTVVGLKLARALRQGQQST
ncbi:DUF998 domain-containing protein [Labrenzia sp. OB1]|uniref:DUF998 domain-containing protein n=1 Tax=Labrenzia sp. OB1 TaxID=1561204 RepID=UPI000837E121|nr:DUF998 domain-containing protein [Labrenzia sp. OB1]